MMMTKDRKSAPIDDAEFRAAVLERLDWIRAHLRRPNAPNEERVAMTVLQYARSLGRKDRSRIYDAINAGEIPYFIPPGTKTKHIPTAWIRSQIDEQLKTELFRRNARAPLA
jgi:predicted DNA-binding transcriptional regulator AlpA